MATRLYLTRTAFSVVNPGTMFTWGSSVKSIFSLGLTNPAASTFLTSTYTGYGAGTVLFRQFITVPLAAGIVFDTTTSWTMVMRQSESSTSANAFQLFGVALVSSDGTVTRDKFDALEKDGTELSTSLTARSNAKASASGLNATTIAGDRLVLEVGWDQDATGSYSISNSLGNTGSDLSGDGDTAIRNPYLDCSVTLTADGGGEAVPPATNEDFDMTLYISGVLDEWA